MTAKAIVNVHIPQENRGQTRHSDICSANASQISESQVRPHEHLQAISSLIRDTTLQVIRYVQTPNDTPPTISFPLYCTYTLKNLEATTKLFLSNKEIYALFQEIQTPLLHLIQLLFKENVADEKSLPLFLKHVYMTIFSTATNLLRSQNAETARQFLETKKIALKESFCKASKTAQLLTLKTIEKLRLAFETAFSKLSTETQELILDRAAVHATNISECLREIISPRTFSTPSSSSMSAQSSGTAPAHSLDPDSTMDYDLGRIKRMKI